MPGDPHVRRRSTGTRRPYEGIGKPEPLKYGLAGGWSRRITDEHRLVYRMTAESVEVLQARYRY